MRFAKIIMLCSGVLCAQQPSPSATPVAAPTGSVTGTVYVQDTQQPARFVQVMLQSVASASTQERGFSGFSGATETRTEVDGTFTMNGVAPGDYYVTAGAPGYIGERALLQAAVANGADPAALLSRIPTVHVVADSPSTVNVTLQRGGALSGRVVWEDGSPAIGISVTAVLNGPPIVLPSTLTQIRSPGNSTNFATTDDRGAFRIAGLAAGDYLLEAVIQSRGQFGGPGRPQQAISTIRIYAPGTFHKASAKPITVRTGDERNDLHLVIDLRGLHTVSGHATSSNASLNVASGRVFLADPTDSSLQLMGSIEPDGSFSVRYVPPGSYTLQINGANTQANGGYVGGRNRGSSQSNGTSFQPLSMALTVTDTDLSGVVAALTPVQTTPQ
jgi:hypothetical protein